MDRETGTYCISSAYGEVVRAFVPHGLPPTAPALALDADLIRRDEVARSALARLAVARPLVPSMEWFLYGFVRKEAVLTSQIEGTQATLEDVFRFEATDRAERPEDVEEVCNYVAALTHAREQLADPKGLPVSGRLLCDTHRVLMHGVRGADKLPGEIRRSQNWIGGPRPGRARFVPAPPDRVARLMSDLERWIQADDPLPVLVKTGLAHAQFETIHPFLDGNGRIGRMLITLLIEHWGLLDEPLLYLSQELRRRQREYYDRLTAVRSDGDWEGWLRFFLECVRDAADDGVHVAQTLHQLVERDRRRVVADDRVTVTTIRLLDRLPRWPVLTVSKAVELTSATAPTARAAVTLLERLGILRETSGKKRDRIFAYSEYLEVLTGDGAAA